MRTKRIIPCLDIRNGRVVKGVKFENVREVEDPVTLARYYVDNGADELVFYDITASVEQRKLFTDVLDRTAREITIPLTVGGGISELSDFARVIELGANKVSINSGALNNPALIAAAAKEYGSERVVLSVDIKRVGDAFRVYCMGGKEDAGRDMLDWVRYGVDHGAGELVINAIDTDGMREGFDLEMLRAVCDCVQVPVIASGGAGNMQHFADLFREVPAVDAGLAASIFHLKEVHIPALKAFLREQGFAVRA